MIKTSYVALALLVITLGSKSDDFGRLADKQRRQALAAEEGKEATQALQSEAEGQNDRSALALTRAKSCSEIVNTKDGKNVAFVDGLPAFASKGTPIPLKGRIVCNSDGDTAKTDEQGRVIGSSIAVASKGDKAQFIEILRGKNGK